MNDWQLIETAPKDRTRVLVYGLFAGEINGPETQPSVGVAWTCDGYSGDYVGFDWVAENTDAHAGWWKPSHWMPIPTPPA